MDSLLEEKSRPSMNATPRLHQKSSQMSGQIYDRLTQTETLNNLLSTFTGVCLLMDEVYEMYF
jgi:hypothetical protein